MGNFGIHNVREISHMLLFFRSETNAMGKNSLIARTTIRVHMYHNFEAFWLVKYFGWIQLFKILLTESLITQTHTRM